MKAFSSCIVEVNFFSRSHFEFSRWPVTFDGPVGRPYVTALSTSFTTNAYWTGPAGTFSSGNPLAVIEGGVLVGATLTVSTTTAPKGACEYTSLLLVAIYLTLP